MMVLLCRPGYLARKNPHAIGGISPSAPRWGFGIWGRTFFPGHRLRDSRGQDSARYGPKDLSARTATAPSSLHITPARARVANSVGRLRRKAETKDEGRRMKDELMPGKNRKNGIRRATNRRMLCRPRSKPDAVQAPVKNGQNAEWRAHNPPEGLRQVLVSQTPVRGVVPCDRHS
jgi:hypothetical protein